MDRFTLICQELLNNIVAYILVAYIRIISDGSCDTELL